MGKKLKIAFLLFSAFVVCFVCSACGGSGGRVPDSYITQYFMDKFGEYYSQWYSNWNYSTEHSYDTSAHVDTVMISLFREAEYGTCSFQIELKYQYDRSSDLWSLFAESKWPEEEERTYVYNDNILGEYDFAHDTHAWTAGKDPRAIHLNVTSVDQTAVTIECSVDYERSYKTSPEPGTWWDVDFDFTLEDSGSYEYCNGIYDCIKIPLSVPDGYTPEENYVIVYANIDSGIYDADLDYAIDMILD